MRMINRVLVIVIMFILLLLLLLLLLIIIIRITIVITAARLDQGVPAEEGLLLGGATCLSVVLV